MPEPRIDHLENLYREVRTYRSLQSSSKMRLTRDEFGIRDGAGGFHQFALDTAQARVMDRLRSAGFEDVESFERALCVFLTSFQNLAVEIAMALMARFEQALQKEDARYQGGLASIALHQALGQTRAREYYEQATAFELESRSIRPEPELHQYLPGQLKMKAESRQKAVEARRLAEAQVEKIACSHPILNHKDIDGRRLAAASQSEVKALLLEHIRSRRADIEKTRKNIEEDPSIVFKLDVLLRTVYGVMRISPGSIQDLIIQDRIRTIRGNEALVVMALGLLALGAGLISGGSGAIAVVAWGVIGGIGVGDAVRSLRQYELESAANGSRLLSDDPSLGWVLVAVLGAGLDLAVAAKVITAIRPVVSNFNRSGNLVQLENGLKSLHQIKGELRVRIVAAAQEERQIQQVINRLLPEGSSVGKPGRGLFGKQSPAPSGALNPRLQQMYLRELESKWFRTKLSAYAKLLGKDPVDWDALAKMVRTAEFREYATVQQMMLSGGYAGYTEGRLILGMSKLIREIPILGRSAIQHELVHVFQELTLGLLKKESAGRISYAEVIKAETSANLFGSPAVILTFIGFTVVVDSSAIYFYQKFSQ